MYLLHVMILLHLWQFVTLDKCRHFRLTTEQLSTIVGNCPLGYSPQLWPSKVTRGYFDDNNEVLIATWSYWTVGDTIPCVTI